MRGRVAGWLDERTGASHWARASLNKIFPDHWSFLLGEIALYSFVVVLVTGVYLTLFYEPSAQEVVYSGAYEPLVGVEMSAAYRSVLELSFDVRAGIVMRQVHHWAAILFVAAIALHLMRVFFTGAFRRPRELNWFVGVTLLSLSLVNGFSGYALPDDLLSAMGVHISYSVVLSIPVIGPWLAFLVFGGEYAGAELIPRLFVTHVLLVPGVIIALIALHLWLVWRQGHTQFPGAGRTEDNVVGVLLWPTYAARSLGLFFAVFALLGALGGLAQINPIWLFGPSDPSAVTTPAQPDWFLAWVEGALRIFPPFEIRVFDYLIPNPFFPGILLPLLTFALLYSWPFLEGWATKDRHAHNLLDRPTERPARTAIGVAVIAFYALLLLSAINTIIAAWLGVPIVAVTWFFRVMVLAFPPALGFASFRLLRIRAHA